MIRQNGAALIVSSTTRSVADVSARLRLEASWSHEIGDETPNSRRVPPLSEPRYERDSRWVLAVDDDDPVDTMGFGSVRRLLARLTGREEDVRALSADFDVWIQWTGVSDSRSGGFVVPMDMLAGLATLGCPLMLNAELAGDEPGPPVAGANS